MVLFGPRERMAKDESGPYGETQSKTYAIVKCELAKENRKYPEKLPRSWTIWVVRLANEYKSQ